MFSGMLLSCAVGISALALAQSSSTSGSSGTQSSTTNSSTPSTQNTPGQSTPSQPSPSTQSGTPGTPSGSSTQSTPGPGTTSTPGAQSPSSLPPCSAVNNGSGSVPGMVIFLFLRNLSATIIPSVAVPLSLVGTFGVMYLLGYSLNNLTLMALTISTGFVVDDAIVMIENIDRYLEEGETPLNAALKGAGQIGFTIVSLTVSLIAVLIPLLFMGDVVGRLFREFAVTLAVTILVSAVVSLTLTPMMCAKLLKSKASSKHGRFYEVSERVYERVIERYGSTLQWVLKHQTATLIVTFGTLVFTIFLFIVVPKGFFPVQDTGVILGISDAPQTVSFTAMAQRQQALTQVILKDPAVESLSSFIGIDGINTTPNSGRIQINLKSRSQRKYTASEIIRRLQPELAKVEGVMVPLSSFSHFEPSNTPLAVNHQAQFPSVTLSFNLAEGISLGDATQLIEKTNRDLNLPTSIHASFQGTAAAFQDSLSSEPILILAALAAVYIVLGILYESYIHPITILSTLPSAGVGALLALLLTHNDLNVIALIGVLLLIGIVKKNAIMLPTGKSSTVAFASAVTDRSVTATATMPSGSIPSPAISLRPRSSVDRHPPAPCPPTKIFTTQSDAVSRIQTCRTGMR